MAFCLLSLYGFYMAERGLQRRRQPNRLKYLVDAGQPNVG
jgi:hypothetical protein